jgi:hypothetical protein
MTPEKMRQGLGLSPQRMARRFRPASFATLKLRFEPIGLFRIEVTESPGSGVRILNQSPPAPLRESVKIAEQNHYSRSTELVGDRNPLEHEFAVQLRSFDAARADSI